MGLLLIGVYILLPIVAISWSTLVVMKVRKIIQTKSPSSTEALETITTVYSSGV